MDIAAAARATGKFFVTRVDFDDFCVGTHEKYVGSFTTYTEAQAACDRHNLLAVLDAIRVPSDEMISYGLSLLDTTLRDKYTNMINMLIEEIQND